MKDTVVTTTTQIDKEVKDPSQRKHSSQTGNHRPHPRSSRRPDDPNPLSVHRRRDPNAKPSDRDRERNRERRERPPGDYPQSSSRRLPRPRSISESSIPNDRSRRRKEDGHIHKPRSRREKDDIKTDDKKSGSAANGKRRLHPVDKIDLLDVTGLYGSHGCITYSLHSGLTFSFPSRWTIRCMSSS